MIPENPRTGFIGFGEVGYYFAKGLKEDGVSEVIAFDVNADAEEKGVLVRWRAADARVQLVSSLKDLIERSDLIISSVWGNMALEVASEAAAFISGRKVYCDINNTAPSSKERESDLLKAKGVEFIDMALFTDPSRSKHRSFVLISGDGAAQFKSVMDRFSMNMTVVPGPAGKATTIKTLVNIYYKGIQAICLELALSAWKAGVDLEILAPLVVKPVENLPKEKEFAFWMIRGAIHATRKAAELESVAEAVERWGVKPIMLQATKERLHSISEFDLKGFFRGELALEDYREVMQAIDRIQREKQLQIE